MSLAAQSAPLIAALEQLGPHDHFCSIYESPEEHYAVAIPFMQIGLDRGEKCIYIADDGMVGDVRHEMESEGIDVERAIASNALVLSTKEQAYLEHGSFDPEWMFTFWKEATQLALSEGFSAVRATGETEWVLRGGRGLERWMEYESKLTHTLSENKCSALCQYNRSLFPPELILDVIRTHPMVVYRGTVCRNLYYVPPDEFLGTNQAAREVERVLTNIRERERVEDALRDQLKERRRAEKALRRSQSYLAEAQRLTHTGSWAFYAEKPLYWSEENLRIWGFDPQQGLPDSETILQRVHPEDRNRVLESVQNAVRDKSDYADEFRIVLPDSTVKHIQALGHPVFSASGELVEVVGTNVDVTDRKRAEEAQLRLASIVASSDDAIISKTLGGVITSWNAGAQRIFGYTAEEAVGLPVTILIPPDRQNEESQIIERIKRGESVDHFETVRVRKDGREINVSLAISPMMNAAGQIIGASKIARDITERHQARAALETAYDEIKKSEDRLRMVIDTIPGMVWSGLTDGTFDFVNQPWLRYLGCSWEELSAQGGLLSAVHPDDVQESIDRWETTRATGKHTDHEVRMRGADGKYRWFLARVLPLRDETGNIIRWYGTVTDIEDRKRAEMLLGGEKRLLEMIARGDSPALILDALCRLVEELASGSLSSILLLDPNGNRLQHGAAPSLPQSYSEAIDGSVIGPSVGSCGTAAYRKEPVIVSDIATDELWVDYRDLALAHGLRACWSTPILSSDGRVLGTFAIYFREPRSPTPQEHNLIEQITHLASIAVEREQAEDALRKAQADLAHVSRVTTMGELVASIAHEVNQPLGAIVTNGHACVRLLSSRAPDLDKSREVIGRMINEGMRASEVIKRIRDVLHKAPPEKVALNINETVQEVIALVSSDVLRSKVELRAELAADLPFVTGDRIQLQQVILNLILNAKDAMSAAQTNQRGLLITSRKGESGEVVVAVRDSGNGLDPESLTRIFAPFFTTKPGGMGMGLAISRSIIEGHGGRLWASPNEPQGTVFQFTLPAENESALWK